jgi:DNA mismatch repair protein MutH
VSASRKTRALTADRFGDHPSGLDKPALHPASEVELLARARGLSGHTLGELAARAGVRAPLDARRAKGATGALVERLLGASAGNASVPDFPALGIELKTIPLTPTGKPRESTFVCTVALREIGQSEWEQSGVQRKLARVLWVPVQADPAIAWSERRVGSARLWSPNADEEAALRADWEELASVIGGGDVERLTARVGRCLQVRPKAANSRVLGRAVDEDGVPMRTLPRGFYLRASFTARIFA